MTNAMNGRKEVVSLPLWSVLPCEPEHPGFETGNKSLVFILNFLIFIDNYLKKIMLAETKQSMPPLEKSVANL